MEESEAQRRRTSGRDEKPFIWRDILLFLWVFLCLLHCDCSAVVLISREGDRKFH
jgi:hypothetical protein